MDRDGSLDLEYVVRVYHSISSRSSLDLLEDPSKTKILINSSLSIGYTSSLLSYILQRTRVFYSRGPRPNKNLTRHTSDVQERQETKSK